MKLNELNAYEIIKEQELTDISSKGTYLRHKKTGAKVCVIENHDENKVFYIGFRTPVADSTGVTHIIEHTVLCGSEKYPLKDPFLELVKGSLNTFLNAMTYPDKTVYPVASCNEKDYDNLMDVYLDAVFHPNISKYEEIFKQEGWHYELDSPDGELTINGVVYNEMKGAFSNPDSVHDRLVSTGLYPDTGYANESGGDPKVIPSLKYEDYLEFYRTHYHPSNAYIYLYGDHDIAKRLDYIDREYLSKYDMIDPHSEVLYQKAFEAPREMTEYYGISEDDSLEDGTYISYNVACDVDTKTSLAMDTLFTVLAGMAGTPVKQALLDAGLGSEVSGGFDDAVRQPVFQILLKGAKPESKDVFVKTVKDELKKAVDGGLNKKAILAAINNKEFDYRESDFGAAPKGLVYGLSILTTWLYDDNAVFDELDIGKYFKELRDDIDKGYFEELVNKQLLNNPHALTLSIIPQRGLNKEYDEKLAKELAEKLSAMSDDEKAALINETEALHEYQETPNTPEELRCLPLLEKSDIEREVRPISNIEMVKDDVKYIYHDFESNGIIYAELFFDIEDLTEDELKTLTMVRRFLRGCSTKLHTFEEMAIEKNMIFGGIELGNTAFDRKDCEDDARKSFIRFKVLPDNLDKAAGLLKELFTEYDFSDKNRTKQILMTVLTTRRTALSAAGHQTAVMRARSYFSQTARFNDTMEGLENYDYLSELSEHFDERIDALVEACYALIKKVYNKKNILVSLTCDKEFKDRAIDAVGDFISVLPVEGREISEYKFKLEKKNEALTDASNIQYVARAWDFKKHGFKYTGELNVLRTVLSYSYLWGQVRVLGGAYGCMCAFMRNGEAFFVSYRDPNLEKTNEVFEHAADFIESYDADERDMLKSVIGTISSIDMPLSPEMKGSRSMNVYMTGYELSDLQREKDEVLNTTVESIRKLAPMVRAMSEENSICVVGNETKIKENSALFFNVRPLIK